MCLYNTGPSYQMWLRSFLHTLGRPVLLPSLVCLAWTTGREKMSTEASFHVQDPERPSGSASGIGHVNLILSSRSSFGVSANSQELVTVRSFTASVHCISWFSSIVQEPADPSHLTKHWNLSVAIFCVFVCMHGLHSRLRFDQLLWII